MIDDFATKRAQLKGQLLRDMADECWKICAVKNRKKDNYDKYIQELKGSNEPIDMDFNPNEQKCVDNCSTRVKGMYRIIDRHIDE